MVSQYHLKCMVSHRFVHMHTLTNIHLLPRYHEIEWVRDEIRENCAFNILYRRTSCDFIGKTRVVGLRMDTHIIMALYEYEGEAFSLDKKQNWIFFSALSQAIHLDIWFLFSRHLPSILRSIFKIKLRIIQFQICYLIIMWNVSRIWLIFQHALDIIFCMLQ